MFGKKFSEYVRFERWILILIGAVFLVRLALPMAGASVSDVRLVSINIVLLIGLIYASVAVQTAGFGTYKHLFGLLLVQAALAHLLIALGIAIGIVTGTDNIYTAPEFFGGSSGRNWPHVGAHVLGVVLFAAISWLIGSAILFVTRKIKPAV